MELDADEIILRGRGKEVDWEWKGAVFKCGSAIVWDAVQTACMGIGNSGQWSGGARCCDVSKREELGESTVCEMVGGF
mgnify:CR=1 FL=1